MITADPQLAYVFSLAIVGAYVLACDWLQSHAERFTRKDNK